MKELTASDYGTIAGISSFLSDVAYNFAENAVYFRRDIMDTLKGLGFTMLGEGSFRMGFVHESMPHVVFKVGNCTDARYMAETEYDFYNSATAIEKPYLAECYHATEFVGVMERVYGHSVLTLSYSDMDEAMDILEYNSIQGLGHKYTTQYDDAGIHNIILDDDTGLGRLIDYSLFPWHY